MNDPSPVTRDRGPEKAAHSERYSLITVHGLRAAGLYVASRRRLRAGGGLFAGRSTFDRTLDFECRRCDAQLFIVAGPQFAGRPTLHRFVGLGLAKDRDFRRPDERQPQHAALQLVVPLPEFERVLRPGLKLASRLEAKSALQMVGEIMTPPDAAKLQLLAV